MVRSGSSDLTEPQKDTVINFYNLSIHSFHLHFPRRLYERVTSPFFASSALISKSSSIQLSLKSPPEMIRRAISSFGSFSSGELHRSMVLAFALVLSAHQVSHQSHSWGRLKMGTECCA